MEIIEISNNPLLKRAFHCSCIINNKVYIHGGVSSCVTKEDPYEDVIEFDPTTNEIKAVLTESITPRRSHHGAAAIDDRWMCIVGGWDGKQRTSDVHIFDTSNGQWTALSPTANNNPPVGLSSHTCTKIGAKEIIVIGREGGVRMQRRYGSVFRLSLNMANQNYHFNEMPIHTSSRSGHSACLLSTKGKSSSNVSLVIYGGRDGASAEIFGEWSVSDIDSLQYSSGVEKMLANIVSKSENKGQALCKVSKPVSLRHHSAISAGRLCLIQGGEVFGKARDSITDKVYVHDATATRWWTVHVNAKHFDPGDLKRSGHTMFYLNDMLYLAGGIGRDGKIALNSIVQLKLNA